MTTKPGPKPGTIEKKLHKSVCFTDTQWAWVVRQAAKLGCSCSGVLQKLVDKQKGKTK
jgi:hypothetical protein